MNYSDRHLMNPRRLIGVYIGLALITASLCIVLSDTPLFRNFHLLTLDMFFQLRSSQRAIVEPTHLVIIEITHEDLQKIGHWPWPRARIAEFVKHLSSLGAKAIVLDFLYSEPTTPSHDDALAAAIKEAGNVYLPSMFTFSHLRPPQVLPPIETLRKHAKGVGVVTTDIDTDGKIRHAMLFFNQSGQFYKSLILKVVEDYYNVQIKKLTPTNLTLANDQRTFNIPLVNGDSILLNWQGRWKETFRRYSFSEINEGVKEMLKERGPAINFAPIKDSLCIVGLTSLGMYDTRPNSLEPEYPGVGVIATALDNILNQNFLRVMPSWLNLLIVYLYSLIAVLYIFNERSIREVVMLLFTIASMFLMYFLFTNNYTMNFLLPFISLLGSYIVISAYHSARIAFERRNLEALATTDGLTGLYNIRYFREILKNACWEAKHNLKSVFYVILCDIDYFKQLNDRYGHQAGDYVIEQVARTLKNSVREQDIAARYGGDEMVLLLRSASHENAVAVAEKIRNIINGMDLQWEGQKLSVQISLGITRFNPETDNELSIIKKADSALLHAKKTGRNQVVVF